MNDRELLELAARAAGHTWRYEEDGQMSVFMFDRRWIFWTPLLDDGDALRLAAKCKLVIHFWEDDNTASVAKTIEGGNDPHDTDNTWVSEPNDYRRAIVRAAAAIGAAL